MTTPVRIMGDVLEGGGQILRIAIAVSALTGTPVLIDKIRAGRKKGGLSPQHLHGVKLVASLCGAHVEGATMGSTQLLFQPGCLRCGHFTADTKTAGSISHLLQVALPCCLFTNGVTRLTLKGGTNAEMAPQIDYTTNVFLPVLQKFGASFKFQIKRRGFFPAGQGEVEVEVGAVRQLQPVQISTFGEVQEIDGEAFYAGKISQTMAEEMAGGAQEVLQRAVGPSVPVRINVLRLTPEQAFGSGWGINVKATTTTGCVLGASQVGRQGMTPQQLGREAGEELALALTQRLCVDQHMQDQLPLLMALAAGESSILTGPITLHTQTAIHVIHTLTGVKFDISPAGPEGGSHVIRCHGVGLVNPNPRHN